jgi:predicted CopG family antitoxin
LHFGPVPSVRVQSPLHLPEITAQRRLGCRARASFNPQKAATLYIDIFYMSNMSSHTVALDDEAYTRLKGVRASGESFSEVVKRLTADPSHLADFVGIWKGIPAREFAAMERERASRKSLGKKRVQRLLKDD